MSESWHASDENSYVAPEGWYQSDSDPSGIERFWDGAHWTLTIRTVGEVGAPEQSRARNVSATDLGYIAPPGYRSGPGMMGTVAFSRVWPEKSESRIALAASIAGVIFLLTTVLGVIAPGFGVAGYVMGRNEKRAIDAGLRDPAKRRSALAAMIIGGIVTVLGLLLIAWIALVAIGFALR